MIRKVKAYLKRLLRPLRLEGLWAWAEITAEVHKAGIPVQSGTVPVERVWTWIKKLLPTAATSISLRWFRVLMMVGFMRYNYVHFTKDSFHDWIDKDYILGHQLEMASSLCTKLYELNDLDMEGHFKSLFDPFRDP